MKLGAPGLEGLGKRLAWVTGLRLVFLIFLLAATASFYLRGELSRYPASQTIVFVAIGAAFALAAFYAAVLREGRHLSALATAQLVLDQITWTAIVYVSGGVTSGATSFYGLTCLVGAVLIGLRGAALAAVSGVSVYALLGFAFAFGWIHPPRDQNAATYVTGAEHLVYPLLVNSIGIVIVAILSGYLAERLRRTGGALAVATQRVLESEQLAVLGRIAAGLAHEIRNPLGSISGSIEMLRESPELSPDDKLLCGIIQREATRLNDLVSDMMDLAKPRAASPEAVDVAALARDVVALASRSERSSSGDVTVRYEGPDTPTLARCDGAQMRQVLWNLVRNGVQASGAGAAVTVRVEPRDDKVSLAVEDGGPGIDSVASEKIFEAFFTTRSHGAGLGLAVVKRIMDEHAQYGATMNVLSPANGGATFRIALSRAGV